MREIPEQAIKLVKQFEGIRLNRYTDATGNPTIGYGHLCKPNDGMEEITEEKALELLQEDIGVASRAVLRLTKAELNDNQYSALIDFVYNLGSGLYQSSTLRMMINRGEFADIPPQFNRWVYGNCHKLPGLIARRQAEARLFSS